MSYESLLDQPKISPETIIKEINAKLEKEEDIDFTEFPPLYVALFYGEHFDQAYYSEEDRISEQKDENFSRTLFSRALGRASQLFPPISDTDNILYKRYPQLKKIVQIEELKHIRYLQDFIFTKLKNSEKESTTYWYHRSHSSFLKFENPLDMMHQRAVGSYWNFLEELPEKIYKPYVEGIDGNVICTTLLQSKEDPFIPTTTRASVAIKYARNEDGVKAWKKPLTRRDIEGSKFKKIGKVHIFLIPLVELLKMLKSGRVLSTFDQMGLGLSNFNDRRLPEDEYTFCSMIEPGFLVDRFLIDFEDDNEVLKKQCEKRVRKEIKDLDGIWVNIEPKVLESSEESFLSLSLGDPLIYQRSIKKSKEAVKKTKKMSRDKGPDSPYAKKRGRLIKSAEKPREKREVGQKKRRSLGGLSFSIFEKTSKVFSAPQIDGLKYQEVPGDGHCFFHAVSLYLGTDQQELRNEVADYIESNLESSDILSPIIGLLPKTMDIRDYLRALREGIEWADNLEIASLMLTRNRPIVIISSDGSIKNRLELDLTRFTGDPIFIYYNESKGLHYDVYLLDGSLESRDILSELEITLDFDNLSLRK